MLFLHAGVGYGDEVCNYEGNSHFSNSFMMFFVVFFIGQMQDMIKFCFVQNVFGLFQ